MNIMSPNGFRNRRRLLGLVAIALGLAACASSPRQPRNYGSPAYVGGYASYGYGWGGGGYSPYDYSPYGWGSGLGYGYTPPVIVNGEQPGANGPPPPPGGMAPPPPRRPPIFRPMPHAFIPRCPAGKNQACP